jgi:hypothetical protein
MLWMVTVGRASTRRTTMITVISRSSVFHRSSAAVPVRVPVSDVQNVTREPTTVTVPMMTGQRPGSGDVRSAISRIRANRRTCSSAASCLPPNAEKR